MSPPLADIMSGNLGAAMAREPVASLPNNIACPKRSRASSGYHYYPGYSRLFVRDVLSNWPRSAVVLDPWNGSGTTTTVAAELGFDCIGIDLNPAMVVIAKSDLLDEHAVSTIRDHATAIRSQPIGPPEHDASDPLLEWLDEASAARVRTLLRALVGSPRLTADQADDLGPVEAYWLKTLFQVIVNATRPWRTTNPTWIKSRGSLPPATVSWNSLLAAVSTAATGASPVTEPGPITARVALGDSTDLVAHHTHPDLILGSPPYCTRIDYAVATRVELSVLGLSPPEQSELRRTLIGTTTVPPSLDLPQTSSTTAARTMESIGSHTSKASRTYYAKWIAQYIRDYTASLAQVAAISARTGTVVLVVQDSYYKDVHIDLATITREMMSFHGWRAVRCYKFAARPSFGQIHPRAFLYRGRAKPQEQAIFFQAE